MDRALEIILKLKNLLGQKSLGLDISDRSLELVEVKKFRNEILITSFSRLPLEKGVVVRGRIKDQYKLAVAIKKLAQMAKPKPLDLVRGVQVALPESQTYLHVFSLPRAESRGPEGLIAAIRLEAERTLPFPLADLVWTSDLQLESAEAGHFVLAGATREVVAEWREAMTEAGIKVANFNLETLATFGGLFPRGVTTLTAVVDIGAVTTTISLFDRVGLFYSYSLGEGGEALTAEVAKTFELPLSAAEERKVRFGLSASDKNLSLLLTKSLRPTLDELGKLERYLKTKFNRELAEIVLVGGGSFLTGLADYFARNLKVPVRRGEITSIIKCLPKIAASLKETEGLYLEAAGLALAPLGLSTRRFALPAHF